MAYGFGSNYGFDPATIRRSMASYRAPRPSWDVPEGYNVGQPAQPVTQAPAPAGGAPGGQVNTFGGGGQYASTGDPMLDMIRNTTMADALARSRGARSSAQRMAGDDPSLAAAGGLEGLMVGQGEAAQALNRGALNRLGELDARKWQEYVLRLQRQWAEEDAKRQAWANLLNVGGQLGGAVIGAAIP